MFKELKKVETIVNNFNELDKDSSVLLYEQIKIDIKYMIEKQTIKKGEKLPNEKDLCEQFNASRITIRRAINDLVHEGYVEKIHGKGTYAKDYKKPIHILDLKGFSEGLSLAETPITKKIISTEIMESNEEMMKIFNRDKVFEIIKLVRLIKDDHDVFSLDYAYLPHDIYPGIIDHLKDTVSTFNVINKIYNINFYESEKKIEVLFPTEEIAEQFKISYSEPLIKVEKKINDSNQRVVHYSEYYLIANRVSLNIETKFDDLV